MNMKLDSNILKVVLVGALLIGVASALQVNVQDQVKSTMKGETVKYEVEITNTDSNKTVAELSTDSEVSTSLSDEEVILQPQETRTVWLMASPLEQGEGTYMIDLKVNQEMKSLALNVEDGQSSLDLTTSYKKVTVEQGTSKKIKVIVRNNGNREIENIVLGSDLSEKFEPQYPEPFSLEKDESREVSILVEIPEDYPSGEHTYTVSTASGNLKTTEEMKVNIVDTLPMEERLSVEALKPWEKLEENGEATGYEVTFEVHNKGLNDIDNVEWDVQGLPNDWEVTGNDKKFSVEGGQVVQNDLYFHSNGDFSEQTAEVRLVKDGEVITTQNLTLEGNKVGVSATGMFLAGGSLVLGVIALIAVVLAFLYIRERNNRRSASQLESDRSYLENLVDKTVVDEEEEEEEE